jgi:putative hydrolases of HD superfamily
MDIKNIANFIFEINQLAHKPHTGWQLVGVKEPNSVSDHIVRAAQIGYILASMEKCPNPEKVVFMTLIKNNGKTRVGDQDKVAAKYFFKKEAEDFAFSDQMNLLNKEIRNKWQECYDEFNIRESQEAIIAQDADWLEQAFQAKEYFDLGHKRASVWIENVEEALETESAKQILRAMKKTDFTDWWQGMMVMTYKKL